MKGKRGLGMVAVIGIVAVLVILIVLFAGGAFGQGLARSLTPQSDGYSPAKCSNIGIVADGTVTVEDTGGVTLNPGISTVDVSSVKATSLCFFCSESDFTYTVEAVDSTSGRSLATSRGTGVLRAGDNSGIDKPFSLVFSVPDKNCDGRPDDFNMRIDATLNGEDVEDQKEYSREVIFRNGRFST